MKAKTETLIMYSKRYFMPTHGFAPPSSIMNSHPLMLNLPSQSRYTARSAWPSVACESLKRT